MPRVEFDGSVEVLLKDAKRLLRYDRQSLVGHSHLLREHAIAVMDLCNIFRVYVLLMSAIECRVILPDEPSPPARSTRYLTKGVHKQLKIICYTKS